LIDTSEQNKGRQNLSEFDEIWLFGYGSLIYKVDFPYIEKSVASIKGWQRKFWQGSHDHRGTPESPGRVVTLIPAEEHVECIGMAYRVTEDEFVHLDYREKNGYLRHQVTLQLEDGRTKQGVIYIADEDNTAFLGKAPILDIAQQIFESSGPSGENREYLLELANSLRKLDASDEHIFEIEKALLKLV
jgi:cation transport regulator ChaC